MNSSKPSLIDLMDVVFFLQKILIYLGLGFGSIGYFVMLYWAYTGKIEVEGEPFESEAAQRSLLYIAIFLIVAWILGLLYIRFIPKFLRFMRRLYGPESKTLH